MTLIVRVPANIKYRTRFFNSDINVVTAYALHCIKRSCVLSVVLALLPEVATAATV